MEEKMLVFPAAFDPKTPVAYDRAETYDVDLIEKILRKQFAELNLLSLFAGKKVAVKPNLVMKKSPDAAATTHPAVLEAVIRILKESASGIVIAESSGGPYTETRFEAICRGCGVSEVAERTGVTLNHDMSSREVEYPNGKTSKMFELISPILDCDVIVNLAKLKSHSLTGYSGAVKNYFGTVAGIRKFEMHARFPDYEDFGSMLVDLSACHLEKKPSVNILDAIVAMEGNGPTGGTPRAMNCLLSSANPYALDIVGASLAGIDGVIMLEEAARRGFCSVSVAEATLIGDEPPEDFFVPDFKKPETQGKHGVGISALKILPKLFGGRLYKWLQSKPMIDKKVCVGCGECARSCPQKTISLVEKDEKKQARINDENCIKCYCCQELCPFKAVKIKKNIIMKILGC